MKTKIMIALMSIFVMTSCTEEKLINGMTQEEYDRKSAEISAEADRKEKELKQAHQEFKDSIEASY